MGCTRQGSQDMNIVQIGIIIDIESIIPNHKEKVVQRDHIIGIESREMQQLNER